MDDLLWWCYENVAPPELWMICYGGVMVEAPEERNINRQSIIKQQKLQRSETIIDETTINERHKTTKAPEERNIKDEKLKDITTIDETTIDKTSIKIKISQMANTYTQLFIHLVFAVKYRECKIETIWKDSLYKYICGIINGKKQKVYAINGMPDHIHILVSMSPDISVSELVRDIKANSSKWLNEQAFVRGKFRWQEGFGAFSYSKSHLNNVINYIINQEKHHAKQSFEMEYLRLLKEYEIDYEERYLFEWLKDESDK